MRQRNVCRPTICRLETRSMMDGSGFDPPAPLQPIEMEQPAIESPTTTNDTSTANGEYHTIFGAGSSSADGFPDSTMNLWTEFYATNYGPVSYR